MILQNFLFFDYGNFTFLTAEKIISLIIFKTNASFETIKTYILSLDQKLKLLAFFMVETITFIFSARLKHKQ